MRVRERERDLSVSSKEFKSTCPESAATHKSPTFFEKKKAIGLRARAEKKEERRERGIRKANAELSEAYIYE